MPIKIKYYDGQKNTDIGQRNSLEIYEPSRRTTIFQKDIHLCSTPIRHMI
jgi:hypothetical protein